VTAFFALIFVKGHRKERNLILTGLLRNVQKPGFRVSRSQAFGFPGFEIEV
jgi:hypothetical protein